MTEFRAQVADRAHIADRIVELTVSRVDGVRLPPWSPGTHVDLELADGLIRQYSLVGAGRVPESFRIAVLLEHEGRGGSRFIHEQVRPGTPVIVRAIRNNFRLVEAARYLFIAGGIGVTPLLPMVADAESRGVEWRMLYMGRTLGSMAYADELRHLGSRVELWSGDTTGRVDLLTALAEPSPDTQVYCCGPARLTDAVEAAMTGWPEDALHVERFTPPSTPDNDDALSNFEIELRRTGLTLPVPAGASIVDVCQGAGVVIPTSCREGTCGSCESLVLSGTPAHRDSVLSAAERASGEYIMACVSRSSSPILTLDL